MDIKAAKTDTNVSIGRRCRSFTGAKNWTRIESRAADPCNEGPELQVWKNANEQSKAGQTREKEGATITTGWGCSSDNFFRPRKDPKLCSINVSILKRYNNTNESITASRQSAKDRMIKNKLLAKRDT